MFISNTKPINQKRDAIHLLRADHYTDDELYLEFLIAIIEAQSEISKKNIVDIDVEVYDNGDSHYENLIDYMSDKLNLDKTDFLKIFE